MTMADRRDKPDGPDVADEFGTIDFAPRRRPESMETIAPSSPAGTTPGDTPPADIYATMAREIPAGAAGATIANMPPAPAVAGLPFDRVGEYDILDKIGHGGMGLVLKARSRRLKRIVALKLIKVGQLAEEQEVARFMVEARAAAHLEHPNIVGVYDVGEHAGSPFFTMEYVEGQSLHKLISERPLQPQRAAIIIRKLALAVDYAHKAGILHRDLKPQNILLDKYEEPKITDFGLATNAQENSQLTATGTVLGTPSYMPPEQARGKHEEMGKWSDVYSLGATLYETLVGRPPFTAATLGETLQQVMTVDPVSPRRLNPAIPRDVETICLKCLEKSPARRYQTAGELAEELQRFLEDRPILARPTSRTEKFVRWCRRNPVVAGAITAVSVAALFAIISLWIGLSRATAALKEADERGNEMAEMVDDLMVTIGDETLLNQPGMQQVRAEILTKAQSSYERLLGKLEKNQRLPEEIAVVKSKLGKVKLQLGDRKEGLRLMNEAAETLATMHEQDAKSVNVLTHLSKVKTEIGGLYFHQRDFKAAAGPLQEALLLRRQLVELEPDNIEAGQLLANSEMNMGLLFDEVQQSAKALVHYKAADSRRAELLKMVPENAGITRDRAKGLTELGMLHAKQHKLPQAEQFYEEARKAFEKLTTGKDRQLDDLFNLGITWMRLGDIAGVRNTDTDLKAAEKRYNEAVQALQELVSANANVRTYRGTLAQARLNLAQLLARLKNSHEAFVQLTIAFDDLQKLRLEDPSFDRYATKTYFEMLRLKKWKKLSMSDEQELATWTSYANQENGKAWVQELDRRAESAPEFPAALRLEETEFATPHSTESKKKDS
ncbi:MAG: protein kinase [Pirellulaceae bacterium]|nr:protein kinase [Pirellulaceae bacterium]